jgi:type I restriction enzyme, S subunit
MARRGWRRLTLGELLTESRRRVAIDGHDTYQMCGVYGFGRGVLFRDAVRGANMSAPYLYRISAGQIIYSRLKAFEGAFALVPPAADGRYVSNEFPTFDVDEDQALPAFIAHVLARPRTWTELTERITGVGARRERLQVPDFLEFEIELPWVEEQRSIVTAVDVVERAVSAYVVERDAARFLLQTVREELLGAMPVCRLDDVLKDIQAGKSPRAFDHPPVEGERGVLKVSAIRPGDFRPQEAKTLPDNVVFPHHAAVLRGDVLISRANTRQLVGSVCRVETHQQELFLSDKTLRLVPDEGRVDPAFLVHTLASATAREQIERAATGTSESMKNISQRAISGLNVPMPGSLEDQRATAATLDEIARGARHAQRLAECAQVLRAALVESLLTGKQRVRDSRDAAPELATAES